jgi:hypothetical protein
MDLEVTTISNSSSLLCPNSRASNSKDLRWGLLYQVTCLDKDNNRVISHNKGSNNSKGQCHLQVTEVLKINLKSSRRLKSTSSKLRSWRIGVWRGRLLLYLDY